MDWMAGMPKCPVHIITEKLSGDDQYVLFYILVKSGRLQCRLIQIGGMNSHEEEAERRSIGVYK